MLHYMLFFELYPRTLRCPFLPSFIVHTHNLQRLLQLMIDKMQLRGGQFFPSVQEC